MEVALQQKIEAEKITKEELKKNEKQIQKKVGQLLWNVVNAATLVLVSEVKYNCLLINSVSVLNYRCRLLPLPFKALLLYFA